MDKAAATASHTAGGDGIIRQDRMMVPRIGLYVIASWLIAAHFLRAGDLVLTGLCLAAPLLFFLHRRWTLLMLQGLAYAASVVWLITTLQIVSMRQAFGAPWGRSAAILLSVATITLVAGWLLRERAEPLSRFVKTGKRP